MAYYLLPHHSQRRHRTERLGNLSIICGGFILSLLVSTSGLCAQSTTLEDENYYFRAGVGYPIVDYSSAIIAEIDVIKSEGGHRDLLAYLDIGLYWPKFSRSHLIGVAVTGFFDTYKGDGWTSTMNFAQIGPSMQFFLTPGIGDGPYLRLDPGMVMQWSDTEISTDDGTLRFQTRQNVGFGLLAGCGYAIPISAGTRLTIDASYTLRNTGDWDATTLQFGAGMLW